MEDSCWIVEGGSLASIFFPSYLTIRHDFCLFPVIYAVYCTTSTYSDDGLLRSMKLLRAMYKKGTSDMEHLALQSPNGGLYAQNDDNHKILLVLGA